MLCPKWWFSSAGRMATLSATRATIAATRLTSDSAASESRPTDPVIRQAKVFSAMVTRAAAMDSHANRLRSTGVCARSGRRGAHGAILPWSPGAGEHHRGDGGHARTGTTPRPCKGDPADSTTAAHPTGDRLGPTTEGVIR